MKWLGYIAYVSFWHHVQPRKGLIDELCLVDHLHVESEIRIKVEDRDEIFLDFKTNGSIIEEILNQIRAPLPLPIPELRKLADKSGNVGQAGDIKKPDDIKSVNEVLDIKDASAEWMIRWLEGTIKLNLLQQGYGERKVEVYFRETSKYFAELDST